MSGPFEKRAVAFLDVLGFGALVKEAEEQPGGVTKLHGLITTLDAHVRFDNQGLDVTVPDRVKPRYLFVSDSIIFSSPLAHERYDGLDIVIVKATQVAQKLLEAGHLVRGAIAIGNVWQTERNIFGTGYIEAVSAEKSVDTPRILLTDSAAKHWRSQGRSVPELCLEDSGDMIVDILNAAYIRQAGIYGGIEDYFGHLRAHINASLFLADLDSAPLAKWIWMAKFFNDALKRHSVGASVKPFDRIPNS